MYGSHGLGISKLAERSRYYPNSQEPLNERDRTGGAAGTGTGGFGAAVVAVVQVKDT